MEQICELKWRSIGHLLEESAARNQDKTFLIFQDKKISFSDFNKKVNRAANALKETGVKKGDKISIMLPNGFEFPILWFAIAKLGAVMVPTNITYQQQDLKYILTNSEAAYMVIHQDYISLLESIRSEITGLKEIIVVGDNNSSYKNFRNLLDQFTDEFTIGEIGENTLLNLQYTSGTTGFPKGCMLSHRYWLVFGQMAARYIAIQEDDVNMTAQPFYYMDPQWNAILCLITGIPLVIMPRFSPSTFWQEIRKHKVTFFYILGTMPFYLMKMNPDPELEKNHKLRLVICSGIHSEFHEVFEKRWNVPWRDAFGMTETGFDLLVPLDFYECVGSGAMGIPIPTKEAKIVNEHGQEVADGNVGELVVRGEPMMLGYWKNPDATAEVMKGGWFHTGDLALKNDLGYFHWVGRIKDMVRRSGENISTSEVEGILIQHEKVKAVAIIPVPDELRGEEVKAYIVLKDGESSETIPPEKLIEFAKSQLAYFKVPRYIEYVDDLPRTPSERVEKHKLINAKKDLRAGSYDAAEKIWR